MRSKKNTSDMETRIEISRLRRINPILADFNKVQKRIEELQSTLPENKKKNLSDSLLRSLKGRSSYEK